MPTYRQIRIEQCVSTIRIALHDKSIYTVKELSTATRIHQSALSSFLHKFDHDHIVSRLLSRRKKKRRIAQDEVKKQNVSNMKMVRGKGIGIKVTVSDDFLAALYASGPVTQAELAREYGGVTRERIRQLIERSEIGSITNKIGRKTDPVRIFQTIRRSDVNNIRELAKDSGSNYGSLRKILVETEVWDAVLRLFRMRRLKKRRVLEQEMLNYLKYLAAILGRTPGVEDVNAGKRFYNTAYREHFGGMMTAQKLAGLAPNKPGRRKRNPVTQP